MISHDASLETSEESVECRICACATLRCETRKINSTHILAPSRTSTAHSHDFVANVVHVWTTFECMHSRVSERLEFKSAGGKKARSVVKEGTMMPADQSAGTRVGEQ